jgi:ribosome-associated toxin RatA of RatAB toxin-antitoxin module
MLTVEYTDTFDAPAADAFTLLCDLDARPAWITGIIEVRVTPPGPAHLETGYYEVGKFSGFKSEKTMTVTGYEQDRLLTLATSDGVANSFRESYRIEPISKETCRVQFTVEVGGAPKVAEFFMRQEMKKTQPQNAARLKSLLAERTLKQ